MKLRKLPNKGATNPTSDAKDNNKTLKSANKPRSLLDQVEYCDRNGQHELDISNLGISAWPNETVLVPNIRILNVTKNRLAFLPALDHFRALTDLDLSRNSLSNVNDVRFGSIVGLKRINLSRNNLSTLPADLTRLTLLEELNISYNKCICLPDGTHNLKSLCTLDASYNMLEEVGDMLEQLALLTTVNFQGNDSLNVEEMGIRTRRLHEKVKITFCPCCRS
jgi:Leucine-rich repeat (LRR) protein